MSFRFDRRSLVRGLAVAALLFLVLPVSVSAHADLTSSDPSEGATLPSPFTGPVVLTFSEPLADGSKADLVGPDGSMVGAAAVDAKAATMTFTPSSTLAPGAYQARWTSIADDGDLLRGIVKFSVAAATPSPATPSPSPAPVGDAAGGDAILPIVVVLIVVAAGAFYLARRDRPS